VLEHAPARTCGPVGIERSPCQSMFAGRTYDPMLEQPVPEGLHPVEGTHAGAVCEVL